MARSQTTRWRHLHRAFQCRLLRDKVNKRKSAANNLVNKFCDRCKELLMFKEHDYKKTLESGMKLGHFLTEAGCYHEAEHALDSCATLAVFSLLCGIASVGLMRVFNANEEYVESTASLKEAESAFECVDRKIGDWHRKDKNARVNNRCCTTGILAEIISPPNGNSRH